MKTILVPFDGSSNSMRALDYAAAQSKYGPTTVHVLNVEPPLDDYGMVKAYMTSKQHNEAMRARAAGVLKRAVSRVRSAQRSKSFPLVTTSVKTRRSNAVGTARV